MCQQNLHSHVRCQAPCPSPQVARRAVMRTPLFASPGYLVTAEQADLDFLILRTPAQNPNTDMHARHHPIHRRPILHGACGSLSVAATLVSRLLSMLFGVPLLLIPGLTVLTRSRGKSETNLFCRLPQRQIVTLPGSSFSVSCNWWRLLDNAACIVCIAVPAAFDALISVSTEEPNAVPLMQSR